MIGRFTWYDILIGFFLGSTFEVPRQLAPSELLLGRLVLQKDLLGKQNTPCVYFLLISGISVAGFCTA